MQAHFLLRKSALASRSSPPQATCDRLEEGEGNYMGWADAMVRPQPQE